MREKILDMYFNKQMKSVDIANTLGIAQSTVTRTLQKDKRYIKEKELRKENNRKRHVNETKEYIKNTRAINQFSNRVDKAMLDNLHNQDMAELSYKSKLSDMAYRNWNISAYTYDKDKKRFVFRDELGRSADVPKYIKVEV